MPPRYEVRHKGPAIICGGAPSVFVDLEKAKQLRPGAVVLGVNAAPGMIQEIEHTWTQHNNLVDVLRKEVGRPVVLHARSNVMGNGVDYWWPELNGMKGSSGMVGALWAKAMGFDEVIMAGIPLSTSEQMYSEKYPSSSRSNHGFATENSIIGWQAMVRLHKEQGRTEGIYSMSGYTRQIFGPPPGLED